MSDPSKSTFVTDAAPLPARATAVRWQMVGLMMAYSFMSWFNRVSMSVAGTERIIGHGITETEMGFVYSALLLAYAVCMTPGGYLADHKGPWLALVLMGFGSALFVGLTGVVGLLFVSAGGLLLALLIVRSLMGACTAPIYPACARVIAHWLPPSRRACANGLVNGAALVGISSTFLGFGTLIDWFDWPMAFLITGAITAELALVWWWWARDYPVQHRGVNAAELTLLSTAAGEDSPPPPADGFMVRPPGASLLRNRSLMLLTISYACVGYFEYLFYFWTQYYFQDVLHLPKGQSRAYATVLNLAMAAGMMLGGVLSDRLGHSCGRRWGRALVPVVGLLTSACMLGVGLWVREPWMIVVCFAVALAAGGACEGPCWATAVELGGKRGGTAAGIFNTGGNAGGLLAPVVTPWVSGLLGWQWGIGLGAVACLLAVVLWLGIDPRDAEP